VCGDEGQRALPTISANSMFVNFRDRAFLTGEFNSNGNGLAT
jgi:hypothetical protein